MNRMLSVLAVAALALTVSACSPQEKRVLSGTALGVAAGAAGAVVIDEDPLTGAVLGGVAGTAGGYLYDRARDAEDRSEEWERRHDDRYRHDNGYHRRSPYRR